MNCRDFRRQYSSYRDGHDPVLAAEMDDHIEGCLACAAADRALREGVDALRGEQLHPSPGFRDRLELRLASDEMVEEPLPPRVSPFAATAAAILFATLVGLTLKQLVVLPPPVAAEEPMVVAQPKLLPGMPFVAFERVHP